ncbi:LOW QUALITY PROTEIN: rhomboid-related protein 4-like [Alosa sapidissima]|uniref:LOW QUALITY PROTEIN: rhomboid-related protein 4-like n=1 Tax=Alosa sapidissima TaxID=34773 RepID=UPI001C085082|nr:LOW QUALITY PROTEIN: rhomboid-related protein 4-like [Alosa sapidissima]
MMRNPRRGANLGLVLLASQIFQVGIDNIPPVTLATLGLNVYLFLFPAAPLMSACVSVQEAYWHRDWRRLLLSPFHHVDDWHLYYNMLSLIWKGKKLEQRLGGPWFAYLLGVFSLLTGLVYLLLEAGLAELTGDWSYGMQCAVGFSGVLFGLKVVNNHYNPGDVTHVLGFPVANRYACWVELVAIHIIAPGTSFVGHLAGILVGLLYTMGPLKKAMTTCAGLVAAGGFSQPASHFNSSGVSGRRNYPAYDSTYPPRAPTSRNPYPPQNHSHTSAYPPNSHTYTHTDPHPQNTPSDPNTHSPSAPPYVAHPYTGGMSEEEQYQAALRASLNDRGGSAPSRPEYGFQIPPDPTSEEIRRRRLQRFAIDHFDGKEPQNSKRQSAKQTGKDVCHQCNRVVCIPMGDKSRPND